jgi:hypothetical protein
VGDVSACLGVFYRDTGLCCVGPDLWVGGTATLVRIDIMLQLGAGSSFAGLSFVLLREDIGVHGLIGSDCDRGLGLYS